MKAYGKPKARCTDDFLGELCFAKGGTCERKKAAICLQVLPRGYGVPVRLDGNIRLPYGYSVGTPYLVRSTYYSVMKSHFGIPRSHSHPELQYITVVSPLTQYPLLLARPIICRPCAGPHDDTVPTCAVAAQGTGPRPLNDPRSI